VIEWLLLYFGANIALGVILWLAVRPTKVSVLGYSLFMLFLGVLVVVFFLIFFVIALLSGATYNLGDIVESKLREIF